MIITIKYYRRCVNGTNRGEIMIKEGRRKMELKERNESAEAGLGGGG